MSETDVTTTDMTVAMTGPFDASELNWGDGSVRVSRYDVDSDSDVNSEPVPDSDLDSDSGLNSEPDSGSTILEQLTPSYKAIPRDQTGFHIFDMEVQVLEYLRSAEGIDAIAFLYYSTYYLIDKSTLAQLIDGRNNFPSIYSIL